MSGAFWTAFLVNFLFWSGLAIGALVFDALLAVTGASWSLPLRPLAQRCRRLLPLPVALYVAGFAAARMFHWRDVLALVACYAAAWLPPVALLLVYPVAWSVIAVDVVMRLEPGWVSTLFPAYVFTANVYAGIAAVAMGAVASLPRDATDDRVPRDLGSVLLGFALVWTYFTWAQFLVIWYGNLPAETSYITTRIAGPWMRVVWIVFATRSLVPVIVLLPRAGRARVPMTVTAATIVIGFWVECWLMVAPAMPGAFTPAATAAVTAGFGALFAAAWLVPPSRRRPRAAPLQSATAAAGRSNSL